MNKLYFLALLMSFTLAEIADSAINYYHDDELISKFNVYREKYANMYKDIEIDLESKQSSLQELKRLLEEIDTFGDHVDFEETYEKTYNSPSQFCEFICKLNEEYPSNSDRCIELWDQAPEYREHMRLEYSTGGSTCVKYGNGILCVMHVREGKGTVKPQPPTGEGMESSSKTSAVLE